MQLALQLPISPLPSPFPFIWFTSKEIKRNPSDFSSPVFLCCFFHGFLVHMFIKICRFCVFLRPIKGYLHLNLAFEPWRKLLLKSSHVFSEFHHYIDHRRPS